MNITRLQNLTHRHLPLLLFLCPVVGVNLAYLVASGLHQIPQCIPYLSGCTSISSAGRFMPQKGIFLLAMIPTALWSLLFWHMAENWFRDRRASHDDADKALLICGAIASFFLLVYVTTLGIPGEFYALTRKFGVLLYFGFTYIAQLLLAKRLAVEHENGINRPLLELAARLKWYCVAVMAIGIMIVPVSLIEDAVYRKQLENIIEWNYALLIYVYFVIVYVSWRRHGPGSVSVQHR